MKNSTLIALFCIMLSIAAGTAAASISSVELLSENPHQKDLYSINIRVSYSLGGASSCQAQVSTLPSGWLVRDGYQGGKYKTISCSGTTTTFDIKPTDLSSPTIAVEVKGDSSSSTKTLTDSVIVKNQPVLKLIKPSYTSVPKGGSFTVDFAVQNTGDSSDTATTENAVLTIESTNGWVTFAGGSTTLSVGTGTIGPGESLSDSTTLYVSSSASSSSIDYTLTASASNTVQTSVDSAAVTCTDCVSAQAPRGDGGGGGGGGGGAAPSSRYLATAMFGGMQPGIRTMNIRSSLIPFTKLEIDVKSAIEGDVTITVQLLNDTEKLAVQEFADGVVHSYLELTKEGITDSHINNIKVKFKVKKTWLSANKVDEVNIALLRYTSKWTALPTALTESDDEYFYFEATSPGFSYFVIAENRPSLVTSLMPTVAELQSVGEQILDDKLVRQKLQDYFGYEIDFDKSKQATRDAVINIELFKEVKQSGDYTIVEVTVKNVGAAALTNMVLIEAVPKSIIDNVAKMKEPIPNYDIIIKEDPIIQWRFKEVDTTIVAWDLKSIEANEIIKISYKIDKLFEADDHISSIIVKLQRKGAAEDITGKAVTAEAGKGTIVNWIILVITILVLAGVGIFVMKNKGKQKTKEEKKPGEEGKGKTTEEKIEPKKEPPEEEKKEEAEKKIAEEKKTDTGGETAEEKSE